MIPLPSTRTILLAAALLSAGVLCSFAQSANAQGSDRTSPFPPAQATPAQSAPVQTATAQITPAQNTPAQITPAQATSAQLFASASDHYAAGNFAAAAEAFAVLARSAPSVAAYYNLGNAYFRLGQYGHAIAAYEKARALAPAQPDVLANLSRAREAAHILPAPLSRWEHYARKLTPNTWTLLLAVSFWAALALWLVPAQYRRQHGIWRPALLSFALAVLLLSLAGLYPWRQLSRSGTVLEADTPLLLAPVATSPVQTYAQAGQSAQWIGAHDGFDRIRLPDGTEGWIARKQFATTWQIRNSGVQ